MSQGNPSEIQQLKDRRADAQAELEDLNNQLHKFEDRVEARLGGLLDQLSELNLETDILSEQLKSIRDQRLFSSGQMQYVGGAPKPPRMPDLADLPSYELNQLKARPGKAQSKIPAAETDIPDIKTLYRRLARRYHPDLARSESDRTYSHEKMTEINRLYQAGDHAVLIKMAGILPHVQVDLGQTPSQPGNSLMQPGGEIERLHRELKQVRSQINQLSMLPIVRLSLEVKLARHQKRDLLRELQAELEYKVGKKQAERDYLCSQIRASSMDGVG